MQIIAASRDQVRFISLWAREITRTPTTARGPNPLVCSLNPPVTVVNPRLHPLLRGFLQARYLLLQTPSTPSSPLIQSQLIKSVNPSIRLRHPCTLALAHRLRLNPTLVSLLLPRAPLVLLSSSFSFSTHCILHRVLSHPMVALEVIRVHPVNPLMRVLTIVLHLLNNTKSPPSQQACTFTHTSHIPPAATIVVIRNTNTQLHGSPTSSPLTPPPNQPAITIPNRNPLTYHLFPVPSRDLPPLCSQQPPL